MPPNITTNPRGVSGWQKFVNIFVKKRSLPMGNALGGGGSRYGAFPGGFGRFFGLLPGAEIDYEKKAGDAWKNAVIAAALSWINRNLPYAPLAVFSEGTDGQEKIVPKHPLATTLKRPNKFYDGKTLLQATFLSLIAGKSNAYWWVKRDNVGRPLEFWYLPHFDVWPLWNNDSTTDNWITGYAYRQNNLTIRLEFDEVIHFRDGLDPQNPRYGWDAMRSASREIVVDNGASSYAAQLLDNMCIPGLVLSPKGDARFEDGDRQEIKAYIEEESGGENRFRPVVLSGEVVVDKMSFSPQEMTLDTMQNEPVARILSIIGISPMVLGMMIGLEHSTYSNMEAAEKAAWYNCVMPRLALICSELDTQALAMYPGGEDLYCGGDYRKVPALQDNLDDKYKRLSLAVGGPFLTANEARQELGMTAIAEGDELVKPLPPEKPPGKDGEKPNPSKNGSGKALVEV